MAKTVEHFTKFTSTECQEIETEDGSVCYEQKESSSIEWYISHKGANNHRTQTANLAVKMLVNNKLSYCSLGQVIDWHIPLEFGGRQRNTMVMFEVKNLQAEAYISLAIDNCLFDKCEPSHYVTAIQYLENSDFSPESNTKFHKLRTGMIISFTQGSQPQLTGASQRVAESQCTPQVLTPALVAGRFAMLID